MDRPLNPAEMLLADTGKGLMVHLIRAQEFYRAPEPTTLCGRPAREESGTPFELNGCKACCRKGRALGLEQIVDVTGDTIRLEDVEARTW